MVNFHQRIRKLEKAWVKPRSCATCGAGDRIPRRIVALSLHGSLGECKSCGAVIAEDGWPVGTPCITVQPGERLFTR